MLGCVIHTNAYGQNPQKMLEAQDLFIQAHKNTAGALHENTGGKSFTHRARGTDRSLMVLFYVKNIIRSSIRTTADDGRWIT